MPQPADPEDRDQVAGPGRGAAQRIEYGHPGAAHRGSLYEGQLARDAGEGAGRHHGRIRVPARISQPRHLQVDAVDRVTLAAGLAAAIVTAEPAYGDPVAKLPALDVFAE